MPTELKPSTDLSTGFVDNHYLSNYMSEVEKSCDNAHELKIPSYLEKKSTFRIVYFRVMYANLGYDKTVQAAEI